MNEPNPPRRPAHPSCEVLEFPNGVSRLIASGQHRRNLAVKLVGRPGAFLPRGRKRQGLPLGSIAALAVVEDTGVRTSATLHALDLNSRSTLWSFSRPASEPNWPFGPVTPVDGVPWVSSYQTLPKLQ